MHKNVVNKIVHAVKETLNEVMQLSTHVQKNFHQRLWNHLSTDTTALMLC